MGKEKSERGEKMYARAILVDRRISRGYYTYELVLILVRDDGKVVKDSEIYGEVGQYGDPRIHVPYDAALQELLRRNNIAEDEITESYSCGGSFQEDCPEDIEKLISDP